MHMFQVPFETLQSNHRNEIFVKSPIALYTEINLNLSIYLGLKENIPTKRLVIKLH